MPNGVMNSVPKEDPEMVAQGPAQEAPPMDPKLEKEMQAYVMGLSKLLHSKQTQPQVVSMLKSTEDPAKSIPQIALMINDQMESAVKGKGKKPSLDVLMGAAQFLVGDLIEMGNAIGIFQIETEEQIAPILQGTMQTYIERGLKDGSIDPVELQQKVEPLMPEQDRMKALEIAKAEGIPEQPNQLTAMEAYAAKRERKAAGMLRGGR